MSGIRRPFVDGLGTAALYVALAVLTFAAFSPLLRNGFVDIDDDRYVTANPRVFQGLTPAGFTWAWTTFHGNYWQPLSWLSLQLDSHFFATRSESGERLLLPAAFHAESVCWHAASALLMFAVWQRLTGARWRSFLVAALFAVHPMRVESVAWAAERKDVLSVFFGTLTLYAYAHYVEKPRWQRYLGVAAAYSLSLLSKPMLMTLPFVLLLLDYWPLRRTSSSEAADLKPESPARLVLEKLPLFLLAAAIALITQVARDRTAAAVSLSDLPLSDRLANAVSAYGSYLVSTVYPVHLAVLYPHPRGDWKVGPVLGGSAALLVITVVSLWQARRRPWFIVGWLWFVVTLLPVIGLSQGGPQARADRFCYWPHVGLFVAVAWGLGELVENWRIPASVVGAVGALAISCLTILTWIQAGYWHDPLTLWDHALAVTRRNAEAQVHLGKYYLDQGRPADAEGHLNEALSIDPRSTDAARLLDAARLDREKR
jgi:protein O-mannosyl-transferase